MSPRDVPTLTMAPDSTVNDVSLHWKQVFLLAMSRYNPPVIMLSELVLEGEELLQEADSLPGVSHAQ